MRRFVTVLAVTLATLTTPVLADELSQRIPITQADLQDPATAAALYQRVADTAKTLCAKLNRPIYGYARASSEEVAACEREAIDNAIGQAGSPTLATFHSQITASKATTTVIAAR